MFYFRHFLFFVLSFPLVFILFSCSRTKPAGQGAGAEVYFTVTNGEAAAGMGKGYAGVEDAGGGNLDNGDTGSEFAAKLSAVTDNAELPAALSRKLQAVSVENPAFIIDLLICLEGDRHLRELVDKRHTLPQNYIPGDLVDLEEGQYRLGRGGLTLRRAAAASLGETAAAARADGVTLTIGSTYRSYNYQVEVYNRYVREMGRDEADRISARPGHSQHQTGLVVDFSPIDDAFASTAAGRWMAANASRFGWSLSFPAGYETVTGYIWESWHYRYVGKDIAAFIDNYFDGIQQYALRFLHEWALYTEES